MIDSGSAGSIFVGMLSSEFPFAARNPVQKTLRFFLGEAFLGFLAIGAAALTLMPMLFPVNVRLSALIEAGQWAIVGVFALEYGLALVFARPKAAFILNPWRILDFLTIAVPLGTLLPNVSNLFRSSPVLRLIRLVRVVTLGLRASGVIVRAEQRQEAVLRLGPLEVSVLRNRDAHGPEPASWEEFLDWVKLPSREWFHLSNPGPEQLGQISSVFDIPPAFLESHLFSATYPHIECVNHCLALFVYLPDMLPSGLIDRNGTLLLATERGLFTLSRHSTNLLNSVAAMAHQTPPSDAPFPLRITRAFLRTVLDRNEKLVGRFEAELRAMEDIPVQESRPQFFEKTFRLKKELSAAQSDLWRLKGILASLGEGRVVVPGGGADSADHFRPLMGDVEYLYETVSNTREGVLSLIDLHLNVVSFDMNRVMRVLAVVSVLGLIPGVAGGLFGMNLADNPWPLTLPQVTFGVSLGMILTLYLFFVKGWLR